MSLNYFTPRRSTRTRAKQKRDGYLEREFVPVDGEGVTLSDGTHIYTLLAALVRGEFRSITRDTGISTADIFEFLLELADKESILVIYGGSYDFNMWLSDLTRREAEVLYKKGTLHWRRRYIISWRRGKSFSIRRSRERQGIIIYDVLPFFQTSFVNACDSFLGENFVEREMIVTNKAARGTFTQNDAATVEKYNRAELQNLKNLAQELRLRLDRVGLRPSRWDGPGAVATALFKREKTKEYQRSSPEPVQIAAQHAYAGGRFELLKFGIVNDRVWEYDINSAYPWALARVPDLARGHWRYNDGTREVAHGFTLCHVRSKTGSALLPAPFFSRNDNLSICYPVKAETWVWLPEYEAALEWQALGYGEVELVEAWEFIPETRALPFGFIPAMYLERREMKKRGDGAEKALKLGLNSLYGKLAQQIGAQKDLKTGEWRIPPYHQIEWAGYATSSCRAHVFRAALQAPESIIAFETDAVFSTRPLDLPLGPNLGEWEETIFDSMAYIQSGTYFATSDDREIVRTRGVDRGELTLEKILPLYGKAETVPAKLTRFTGLGIALSQDYAKWRKWITSPKNVTLEPTGKRVHHPRCRTCHTHGYSIGSWHDTMCPYMHTGMSAIYPLAWREGDAAAALLAQRDLDADSDYESYA